MNIKKIFSLLTTIKKEIENNENSNNKTSDDINLINKNKKIYKKKVGLRKNSFEHIIPEIKDKKLNKRKSEIISNNILQNINEEKNDYKNYINELKKNFIYVKKNTEDKPNIGKKGEKNDIQSFNSNSTIKSNISLEMNSYLSYNNNIYNQERFENELNNNKNYNNIEKSNFQENKLKISPTFTLDYNSNEILNNKINMNNIEEKKIIISQKINFPKKLEKSIQTIDQNINNNNQQLTFGSYDKEIQNENYNYNNYNNNNYNDNNNDYKYNNNNFNEEKEINYNKEKYFFSPEKNIKNIRIEFQNNIETKKYFDTPYKGNNNILNESNRFNEENSIREKLLRRKNINYLSNNNNYEEINNKKMKINNNVENFEKDILTIRIPSQNIERISYINKTPQIPNKRNNNIERISYINKTPKIDERNFNEKKYKTPQIQKINLAGSNLRYNNSGSNIFQYNNKNSDDIRQSKNYNVYSLTNIQKDNYNDLNNNNINNNKINKTLNYENNNIHLNNDFKINNRKKNNDFNKNNSMKIYKKNLIKENIETYIINNNETRKKKNMKEINNDNDSISSSINSSHLSGISLIEYKNDKITPINYTSQCFFIQNDKNDFTKKRNEIIQKNTMKMKGDFKKFLDENYLGNNPRIQITNAEVPIDKIINNNYDDLNNENSNFNISDKIIKDGDNDVYAKITPKKNSNNKYDSYNFNYSDSYKKNNKKNFSISFPIKEKDFKFDFYNNIIGERNKYDSSKFELIQDYKIKVNSNLNSPNINHNDLKDIKVQFNLAEVNTTKFYKTNIDKFNNDNSEIIKNPFNTSLKKKFNKCAFSSGKKKYSSKTVKILKKDHL